MIFSSYIFLFAFFPIVFAGYFILNRIKVGSPGKWWLVAASLFFYWYGCPSFFPFFVGSVLFNYIMGMVLSKWHKKYSKNVNRLALTGGILANVALLGYYKYTDFFISSANFFLTNDIALKRIVLPIGISFFTFQLIAYLVDSFRGETKEYSFLNYLLFITFFPQLIVGPIVHHKDVVPQYENKENLKLNWNNISMGLFLFFMGAAKKLMIADTLTPIAQAAFNNTADLSMIDSWLASLSYTISYYFDLSGYADMAIGLGLLFNINIAINFNSPYKARNFADYWRRWHITLTKFLGDYIFRTVKKKGGSTNNFYFAIMVTFLVSGFWHGAGWTFVVWGVINGIFVVMSHMMYNNEKKLPLPLAWFITFLGVIGVRVLFVSSSFGDAFNIFKNAFDIGKFTLEGNFYTTKIQILTVIIGLFIAVALPNSNQIREKFKPDWKFALATAVLIMLSIKNMVNVGDFLYFQF